MCIELFIIYSYYPFNICEVASYMSSFIVSSFVTNKMVNLVRSLSIFLIHFLGRIRFGSFFSFQFHSFCSDLCYFFLLFNFFSNFLTKKLKLLVWKHYRLYVNSECYWFLSKHCINCIIITFSFLFISTDFLIFLESFSYNLDYLVVYYLGIFQIVYD